MLVTAHHVSGILCEGHKPLSHIHRQCKGKGDTCPGAAWGPSWGHPPQTQPLPPMPCIAGRPFTLKDVNLGSEIHHMGLELLEGAAHLEHTALDQIHPAWLWAGRSSSIFAGLNWACWFDQLHSSKEVWISGVAWLSKAWKKPDPRGCRMWPCE